VDEAQVARFVGALGESARAKLDGKVGPALTELLARARAAYPELTVSDDAFLALVAEKLAGGAWSTLGEGLDGLDAGELYLACACERGDAVALNRFEAKYFPVVELALAPMKLPTGTVDEVRQLVRTKLFVSDGSEAPKIKKYAGQGSLEGLVRVIAVRAALGLQRRSMKEIAIGSSAVVEEILATAVSPELQIVKQRYRAPFKAAFERAIDELSSRERTLLKLHVIERSSIDEIGALYKVHRATAARWLEAIRDKLGDRTRALLSEQLAIGPVELESVVRAVQSQVSMSLSRILE
jgi:RNA polymerase sigma-70 factor (ECF subfamily)